MSIQLIITIIDTKKSQLEIEKLKDEEIARYLITKVTMGEILKYDTERLKLVRKVLEEELEEKYRSKTGHSIELPSKVKKRIDKILKIIRNELIRRAKRDR